MYEDFPDRLLSATGTPEELVREWGVSDEPARDLQAWGIAWRTRCGEPDHDAEAARLVRRLNNELGQRYTVVYRP